MILIKILDRPFLLLAVGIAVFVLLNMQSFADNVAFYSGGALGIIHRNQWGFALLNIAVFLAFLLPLYLRKKANWKNSGVFSAFVISLFIEMYGFPLSIYLASNALGFPASSHPVIFTLDFLGIELGFDFWMLVGAVIIIAGMALIAAAWLQLWKSRSDFFTQGLYSCSRNPQYVGFLLVVWGWLIAWPTLLTIAMSPVLTWAYYSAAKAEEKELESKKGFQEYKARVPLLF